MAVDRQHDRIIFICDDCDEVFETDAGLDLFDAWHSAMLEGWVYLGMSTHRCCECCRTLEND